MIDSEGYFLFSPNHSSESVEHDSDTDPLQDLISVTIVIRYPNVSLETWGISSRRCFLFALVMVEARDPFPDLCGSVIVPSWLMRPFLFSIIISHPIFLDKIITHELSQSHSHFLVPVPSADFGAAAAAPVHHHHQQFCPKRQD